MFATPPTRMMHVLGTAVEGADEMGSSTARSGRARGGRISIRVLTGAAAVAVMVTTGSAGATPRPAGTFEGTSCTETENVFLRPPSALAPYLPEGFTPREVWPGLSELMILITRCEGAVVNGKSVGPTIFSEVGIYIEDPERLNELGAAAASAHQYYQVWHLTDAPALRKVMAKVGVDGGLVPDATLETPSDAEVETGVPWKRVPYSFTNTRIVGTAYYFPRASNFWHQGKKGLAVTVYPMPTGERYSSGPAFLETPADSALAEMSGSPTGIPDGSTVFTYDGLRATTILLK
ncbi:MAG TPA: hypothetical protein VM573_06680 [Actinomycetota bacterium]|nr:hypothetical protein [Actinomycetota bacterium]